MRRQWILGFLIAVLLVLGIAYPLPAQTVQSFPRALFTVGDLLCADTSSSLARLPAVAAGQALVSTALATCPAYSATLPAALATPEKTDGSIFIPAYQVCSSDNANLVKVRVAANDWALARTAGGAETFNVICPLDSWLQRTTAGKGIKINSIAIAYQVTTQALTSHTWGKVATVTYANNAANTVGADLATAPTLQTATQANPYVTSVAITTPAYLPSAANVSLTVEWQAVMQNLGVYRVIGVQVNFSRTDL